MATTPVFSDEQIASILDLINTTRHTQYIGARYVPIFGRKNENTIEWDNSKPYEPLTIVLYQGNSYTSRQYVPIGTDINNIDFWANTGNYNAQIEQYRQEVKALDTAVKTNTNNITTNTNNITTNTECLTALNANTVDKATTLYNNITTNTECLTALNANTVDKATTLYNNIINAKKFNIVIFGDSWTQVEKKSLEVGMKAYPNVESIHNYGVSGAYIKDIDAQIERFKNDTSYDHNNITHVVVVAGTNNVFWNRPVTLGEASTVARNIANAFPNGAEIHYFPNNSRTINEGRNNFYINILNGFSQWTAIHPEFLSMFGYNNGEFFKGDDTYGVQHLTANGYQQMGRWIMNILMGGNCASITSSALVEITPDTTSDIVFPTQNIPVIFNSDTIRIRGIINKCTWAENPSNKFNPRVKINFKADKTGTNLLPIPINTYLSTIYAGEPLYGHFNGTSFSSATNKSVKENGYFFDSIIIDTVIPHSMYLTLF